MGAKTCGKGAPDKEGGLQLLLEPLSGDLGLRPRPLEADKQ